MRLFRENRLMFFSALSAALCLGMWLGDARKAEAQGWTRGQLGQLWEVFADSGRVTVGDTVGIRFRLRLDERDLLFDTLPRPRDSLLEGVRILSVEKLQRLPNRDFVGRATLAFYRTGPQLVPVFSLPFMRSVKGITHGHVDSDTLTIEVVPVLAAGNPTLRDIREAEPSGFPGRIVAAIAAGALLLAFLVRRRRLTPAPAAVPPSKPEPEAVPLPPDPYEVALARLQEIEREAWSARGEVDRHYDLVTDALRGYLEDAEGVPARERTTMELRWSLPPRLLDGGLRRHYGAVFDEADLVKFARRRPPDAEAATFLDDARGLLGRWREARERPEAADAVR
jgi:hypothetical protein